MIKKIITHSLIAGIGLALLTSCKKPPHHPKHPRYEIIKPKKKYEPSVKNLAKMITQLQGHPYVWAEEGPNNFDCSGLTYYMYGSMGIEIPRVAREQARHGKKINFKDLAYGDLIFFATGHNRHKITHVGIYLGNGWFTHASTTKHEVIYSNLYKTKYYKNRLRTCRRYLPQEQSFTLDENKAPSWKLASIDEAVAKPKPKPTGLVMPNKTAIPKVEQKLKNRAILISSSEDEVKNPDAGYYIQAVSFFGKPNKKFLKHIKRLKLGYMFIDFTQNKHAISRLLIGPFKSRSLAKKRLSMVRKKIENSSFIVRLK